MHKFYRLNIDTPLSNSLGMTTSEWNNSTLGQLATKTNNKVFLREGSINTTNAEYGWKVVDAFFSQEDTYMTYFRAYDVDGTFLPQAIFGVNYGSVPSRIGGGFKYQPEFGNQYYVPIQNQFTTPNTGGYTVEVLDLNNPSEGMSFGIYKQDGLHQGLVISFRLFKLN